MKKLKKIFLINTPWRFKDTQINIHFESGKGNSLKSLMIYLYSVEG